MHVGVHYVNLQIAVGWQVLPLISGLHISLNGSQLKVCVDNIVRVLPLGNEHIVDLKSCHVPLQCWAQQQVSCAQVFAKITKLQKDMQML